MNIPATTPLRLNRILVFWSPLYATWFMMAMEGPFLAAIIARMPEPKFNLAAYGVAFAFGLIIESPIIMMMSASTALVKNRSTYLRLRNFTVILNTLITGIMLLVLIPDVFACIAGDLIGLPSRVEQLTYTALLILIPWPGAIGFRRFYQGLLIRNNLTRRVAYGTVIRLVSMTATALLMYVLLDVDGAVVGASALTAGVTIEAVASRFMVHRLVRNYLRGPDHTDGSEPSLTYGSILGFYYPLALTSILGLAVHPIVTFFMGQSRMALESLAVMPVINSLVFIFRSFGLSYQEVAIKFLAENRDNYRMLKQFAIILGSIAFGGLLLISYTPLLEFWFGTISGLSADLTSFARLPVQILVIIPAASVLLSFQRSLLIDSKRTTPITWATAIEVTGIILILYFLIHRFDLVGAVAASVAVVAGRIMANLILFRTLRFRYGTINDDTVIIDNPETPNT